MAEDSTMRILVSATVAAWLLGSAGLTLAQTRNPLGGQSGAPTGGSLGTTSRMSTPSSGGGRSTSGMFGSRTLGSSLRAGNRSLGGTARGGTVAGMTQQEMGNIGQITGTERFTRGGRQQQGFIGNETGDVAGFFSMLNAGRTGNVQTNNQRRRDPEAETNVNAGGQQNNNNVRRMYRTTRTVGFDYVATSTPELSSTVSQRIQKTPGIRTRSTIDVEIVGRTAVLRGVVATAHDRELAARLASLEPGVSAVQNELEVAQSPPAASVGSAAGPALTAPGDSTEP
jgi:hypothetical protein